MSTPELRTVGKGMRLNAAEIKSKRKTRTKRKNTVNAVIHENDLQNGTEKEIKLWAWLGNPWILSGRNDRSSEGDSLIPKKKDEYGGGGGGSLHEGPQPGSQSDQVLRDALHSRLTL